MKKLKRIFSAFLIGAMALTLLVGCGGSGGSTGSSVQYIDESSAALNTFIASGESWASGGSIDIIENEALRELTDKWAEEASFALSRLCDPNAGGEDGFIENYLKRPFDARCENVLSAEGILNDDTNRMDTGLMIIGAEDLPESELNNALTQFFKDQQHIGENQIPSGVALHVYLVTDATNEYQKAWIAFLVVTGSNK